MFFELVARNSKRSRKDNYLYFSSMIISIIAFYIILSLSNQDVMLFLRKMESDAVGRLLAMIPIFYALTLVILFFLVYYASSVQMERRKREFGVYLMLGMKRGKLFLMLLSEDLRNNVIALGVGLPIAIMISELISLITAKMVGLGVIGHRFSPSYIAVLFTVIGFLFVKFFACVFLSAKTARKEIGELLIYSPSGAKKSLPKIFYLISILMGIAMLGKAYHLGIGGQAWQGIKGMGVTVLLGTVGTILLFFGIRLLIGFLANRGSREKLHTYNFRQIEELVIHRSTILAICSLLIFAALCLFGAGITVSLNSSGNSVHILDYTFRGNGSEQGKNLDVDKVKRILKSEGLDLQFSKILEIKIGHPREKDTLSIENILMRLKEMDFSKDRDTLLHNLKKRKDAYLISLSGYNELRKAANLQVIELKESEAVLYMGKDFLRNESLMNLAAPAGTEISLLGETITLIGTVQSLPIVTDRAVTLAMAFIVPDRVFDAYTGEKYSSYISGILDSDFVKEKGLMKAISDTNEQLNKTTLRYESYIQNMGRQLFFIIGASYVTIYLAIIFLVVANTIIGVQFLMGQRKSYKRYQTLIHLGATYETLCQSSGKQINWYFGLPVLVAMVNSFFGVQSLFTGILPSAAKENPGGQVLTAGLIILLLTFFEGIYIMMVKRSSNQYLWTLMEPKREE